MLSILGRDIEKRELELTRGENNIWQKTFDSFSERQEARDDIAFIIQNYMEQEKRFFLSGEPMAVAEILSDSCGGNISHVTLLKRLNKNSAELLGLGFSFRSRWSNGRRRNEETFRRLHIRCVNDVKKINSIISMEDAVEFQRGREE